jgi:uncharacterized protein
MTDYTTALRADAHGTRVRVRCVPRASRTALGGLHGAAVKIRVAAPPVDGRANAEVAAFIAGIVGVRARDVEIVSGHQSRDKVVRIGGMAPAAVAAALGRA